MEMKTNYDVVFNEMILFILIQNFNGHFKKNYNQLFKYFLFYFILIESKFFSKYLRILNRNNILNHLITY